MVLNDVCSTFDVGAKTYLCGTRREKLKAPIRPTLPLCLLKLFRNLHDASSCLVFRPVPQTNSPQSKKPKIKCPILRNPIEPKNVLLGDPLDKLLSEAEGAVRIPWWRGRSFCPDVLVQSGKWWLAMSKTLLYARQKLSP